MKKKNTWIVIPTYWGHRGTTENPPTTQFDHPTELNSEGTLVRTLESISSLDGEFSLLLVVASTHKELDEEIHNKVTNIARRFKNKFPLFLVSPQNLDILQKDFPEKILSLDSYGNIRNVQLVLPYLAGADNIIAIDDDEIIPDSHFIEYSQKYIYSQFQGEQIHGMAGPYYSGSGEWMINDADTLIDEPNLFLKKNFFMNQGVAEGMTIDGIGVCNIAFGGNMVFSRRLVEKVCHDPYSPRGEDYDYVLNAFYEGFKFYFCPEMKIVHLPPDSDGSQAADNSFKLIADINRFVYQKIKVALMKEKFPEFDESYLHPYPGEFLNTEYDLETLAKDALMTKYAMPLEETESVVQEAVNKSKVAAQNYFDYLKKWQDVLKTLAQESDNGSFKFLLESFRIK